MCRLIIKKLLTLTGVQLKQFAAVLFTTAKWLGWKKKLQAKKRFSCGECKIRKWAEMDRDLAAGCRFTAGSLALQDLEKLKKKTF